MGTSLAIQWLRLRAFNAGGAGSISVPCDLAKKIRKEKEIKRFVCHCLLPLSENTSRLKKRRWEVIELLKGNFHLTRIIYLVN